MKNEFRKKCIEERKQIPQAEKEKASEIVFNKLTSMDIYKKAESIFIYVSMKNEVSTVDIINKAFSDGKTVAVPISLDNRDMYFVKIDSLSDMVKTKLGIYEPVAVREDEIFPDDKTLLVAPGTAFDENGLRLGFGGGYYDTYIEKFKIKNTAALAFDIQIKKEIPYESHDKTMNCVITEKRTIGGGINEQIN